MSKYSTEELIDALNRYRAGAYCAGSISPVMEAIIAKLRAGDKLCEAAKELCERLLDAEDIVAPYAAKAVRKAIAEYEGNP